MARVGQGADLATELPALFHSFVELKADDQALKSASAQLGVSVPMDDLAALAQGSAAQRAAQAVGEVLAAAQAAGLARSDLTVDDLGMLLFCAPGAEVGQAARQRYVQIMLAGLRPERSV